MFLSSPSKVNQMIESASAGVVDLLSEKYKNKLCGVVLRDTPLRIRPTLMPKPSEEGFDLNCETLCRCCEPVILTENAPRGDFYKVQTACSVGFLHKNFLARISRKELKELVSTEGKLFVTDKFVLTNPALAPRISKVPLSFGSRIPFTKKDINYHILLPYRKENGCVGWECATLPLCTALHEGPLKFTRKNLLMLSLRMRGMPYDWGESFGGCDCSSLVRAAFSLCGINLPRNSGDIARLPCRSMPAVGGIRAVNGCRPGDIIVGEGHVMLYYGKKRGVHYVFHSFYGTRGITDITPVTEPTSKGLPLYDNFRKIIPLKYL